MVVVVVEQQQQQQTTMIEPEYFDGQTKTGWVTLRRFPPKLHTTTYFDVDFDNGRRHPYLYLRPTETFDDRQLLLMSVYLQPRSSYLATDITAKARFVGV